VPTPTLVATSGASNANSYLTLAEANTFFDAHLYATVWASKSDATKTVALIMATREIDRRYEWAEYPTTITQALQWPRIGIMERSGLELIGDTVIPVELKDATALYAQALMVADRTADSDIETLGITSLSAGPVSLSFESSVRAKPIPDSVRAMIPTWWGWLRGAGMREVLRG